MIPNTPGSSQNVNVTIPYQHTSGTIRLREFDNVGNEGTPAQLQVSIDPLVADPYLTSLASAASLSMVVFHLDSTATTVLLAPVSRFRFLFRPELHFSKSVEQRKPLFRAARSAWA